MHKLTMAVILLGGFILLMFAIFWFARGNVLMAAGMFVMGLVAESNYYLHRRSMKIAETRSKE